MASTFYDQFERHAHAEGLKAHSTHYCAGCGHGLVHKYLADAVQELGVQDQTIAISPVGCAVFMYYYLDVGNVQAAHGRAPAVAMGLKMANPQSVVISYQGDGDLASIGLAEIMQATQTGVPMTFIFVNNAIYGMTGGQMAPTTLMEQVTTTTPTGRNRLAGEPMKMAETVGQLDGPVYVERVALYDNKQRVRAQKAIKKAVRMQVEGRGLAFVEVLSECPTHLHMTPGEAEEWVKQKMVQVFPLGVKKDVESDPWFNLDAPRFDPDEVSHVIGGVTESPKRFAKGFPSHIDQEDISIKFAGAGGDGAQTIAMLTTKVAINEGWDSTHIPSYGPESRGGTSYADVHIATTEVLSPASPKPHVLVAFNPQSLEKFGPTVRPGGTILYDSTVVPQTPQLDSRIAMYGLPFTQIAVDLGKAMVKNTVALGAMQAATRLFPVESFHAAMEDALKNRCALLPINQDAFALGRDAFEEKSKRDN